MNDTKSNSDEGEDAEKMRLAFEAFMLTGKKPAVEETGDDSLSMATSQSTTSKRKKKGKKKKQSMGGTPPPQPSTPSTSDVTARSPQYTKPSALAKSDKKRCYQLLRSFNDKVKHTWLDIDEQMLGVLKNIVSIRGRLPLEWKLLQSSDPEGDRPSVTDDGDEWKYHGFRGKPKELPYSMHLHTDDIQLALSTDMTQHEKMLAGLRSLISDLAECHDALGRVVDTLWKFHLDCTDDVREGMERETPKVEDDMEHIVQTVTDVYQMLSMELYRKQEMVPLIIESTEDEILGVEGEKSSAGDGRHATGSGLQMARRYCKSWTRGSEESCVDEDLISRLLKLGDTSHARIER